MSEVVYAALCSYLTVNGWQREEPGSGWWWDGENEATLGEAIDEQLRRDGVDTREEPAA